MKYMTSADLDNKEFYIDVVRKGERGVMIFGRLIPDDERFNHEFGLNSGPANFVQHRALPVRMKLTRQGTYIILEEIKEKIHHYQVVCQECKTEGLFLDPKFCTHCGAKLSVEAIEAAPTITETEWKTYQCRQRSW